MKTSISSDVLISLIAEFLRFPGSHICKHHVTITIINELEVSGMKISHDLLINLVEGNDDNALNLLQELKNRKEFLPYEAIVERASGDYICEECGLNLYSHTQFNYPGYDHGPHLGCDGIYYHL